MINAVTHANVWVLDQDEAKEFYTTKLGFEARHDVRGEGYRWVAVAPKGSDVLLVLALAGPPMLDEESAGHLRALLAKGVLGAGVMSTDDVHATFAELSGRGVEFVQEPAERPYGIEALFRDNSGNWFSLTQRP